VVDRVVAADPSAQYLKGCCGNACVTFMAYSCIPNCGSCVAINTIMPALRMKTKPVAAPPDNCFLLLCCPTCALTQVENELDIRAAAGQPIVQAQAQFMAVAPMNMPPMVATQQPMYMPPVVATQQPMYMPPVVATQQPMYMPPVVATQQPMYMPAPGTAPAAAPPQ